MNIIALLKAERDNLTRQLNGINAALTAFAGEYTDGATRPRRRRKLSAKALANIRAAQKARREREKRTSGANSKPAKHHVSAAGLANIRAAQRARWARARRK